ncbi:hypothetical protein C6P46_005135 [Rhodotorula mucilaginosa]|uniref:Uncharacterized protein n=1 Tax=Rhodotorula mucilaginosa TaxID=5537 RepID=A0A9P6W166_RHOMI|nr:hypothetical protein C6P46_005135 [Rhodotorula mucilaginosa]
MPAARPPLAFKRALVRLASTTLGNDAQTTPYTPSPEISILHSRLVPSPRTCKASYTHDTPTLVLSSLIIAGLILSYVPQWYRIIKHKNSEGFSPMFLLLGATSSASSLANIVTLQWSQVACCQYLSAGQCFEQVLGIGQVFTQWLCFSLIFLLYLIYYPLSHKYVQSVPIASSALPTSHRRSMVRSLVPKFMRTTTPHGLIRPSLSSSTIASDLSSDDDYTDSDRNGLLDRTGGGGGGGRFGGFHPANFILPGQLRRGEIILSSEYRHAVSLFFLTVLHFTLTFLTTAILITTLPTTESPHPGNPTPTPPWEPLPGQPGSGKEHASERAVRVWATTVGLMSVVLACVQYTPQLVHTYQRKLVGSLSIPMMLIQTPGSFVFVYTLAIRPNVDVTGWLTYFITGLLQGYLLVLCIIYKRRQRALGVDDWGNALPGVEGDAERSRNARVGGETERERAEARSGSVAALGDEALTIGGGGGGGGPGSAAGRRGGEARANGAGGDLLVPTERSRLLG